MKKKFYLSLIPLFFCFSLTAQFIQELCADDFTNGTLVKFETYQDNIYGTGFFDELCGQEASYMAKWNGNNWEPAEFEIDDAGHSIRTIGDKLYLANYNRSSVDSNWVFYYDGTTVEKLGKGVKNTGSNWNNIYDIIEYQGTLYACGEFSTVGDESIKGIMQWTGTEWTDVDGGLTGAMNGLGVIYPHQMEIFEDELYVVGNFFMAGDIEVNGIAKWNGTTWAALGEGFNSTVYGIGFYNDELFVGGDFTKSGDTDLNALAKWTGTDWTSTGFGFENETNSDYTFVHTIKQIDTLLLITGGLKKLVYDDESSEICGGVIAFDGTNINTFGGGVANNDIEAVALTPEGNLLLGGGVWENGYWGFVSNFLVPYEEPTGINNITKQINLTVAPNPFSSFITLETDAVITALSLVGLNGQQEDIVLNNNTINLQHLESGVYFLNGETEKGKFTKKIVKE